MRSQIGRPLSLLATRVMGKSFPRCKRICTAKRRHYGNACVFTSCWFKRATFLDSNNVEETLEVALRNTDIVAGKNQNGCVEGIDLFDAGARSAQIDLVLVGALGESAGARASIHDGEAKTIRIFATPPDLAENIIGSVQGDLDVHARIAHDSF